jgi:hypothetical protein
MNITPQRLTAAAGVCAASAGVLFIAVQVNHPHLDAASIQTTEMLVRGTGKVLMAAFALAGLAGLYLSQVRRNGLLGLIGYLLLSLGYLLILGTAFTAAFVLPTVAVSDPGYVNDAIAATTGGAPTGDLGALPVVARLQDAGYLLGGLVFGIALFRARVLVRWASLLLAAGGVVTIALSVMPDAFYRLLAFPNGIAMVGLGISLFLHARMPSTSDRAPAADVAPVR